MEFTKSVENRYRHYKGGIYYKISEGIIDDAINIPINDLIESKDPIAKAKYEPTGEDMLIYQHTETNIVAVFKDRVSSIEEEWLADIVFYQSEEGGLNWVRLKDEFDGVNEQGIKRFTLANK